MKTIVLILKLCSYVGLILSTFTITVIVPKIDKKIDKEIETINKINEGRIFFGISALNASHISTRKRIDLLEANLILYLRQNTDLVYNKLNFLL
jgi:hypothetical protein